MEKLKLDISDINKHLEAAKLLIEFAKNETIFLFEAEMGSGKTTFIKSICKHLGVNVTMSSPTYSIVNEYKTSKNKIYHFDLYRIKSELELFELGFEDYLTDLNHVFIEWPQLAKVYVDSYIFIKIKMEGNYRYLYAEIFNKS